MLKEASGRHLFFIKNAGLARFGLFAGGKPNHESSFTVDIKPVIPTIGHSLDQVQRVFGNISTVLCE